MCPLSRRTPMRGQSCLLHTFFPFLAAGMSAQPWRPRVGRTRDCNLEGNARLSPKLLYCRSLVTAAEPLKLTKDRGARMAGNVNSHVLLQAQLCLRQRALGGGQCWRQKDQRGATQLGSMPHATSPGYIISGGRAKGKCGDSCSRLQRILRR